MADPAKVLFGNASYDGQPVRTLASRGQTLIDASAGPSQLVRLTVHQGTDGHCAGLGQQVWSQVGYR